MPPLTAIALEGDPKAALARIPVRAGVGQILGPEGKNLVIGRAANLRKWAGNHLGFAREVAKGRRPPTDLRPIATTVCFIEASSGFHQRLLFEAALADCAARFGIAGFLAAGSARHDEIFHDPLA